MTPRTVFLSYSHKQAELKDRLLVHLQAAGIVADVWDDSRIATGDHWREEIRQALERADAAIFLISADFLSSRFIREVAKDISGLESRQAPEDALTAKLPSTGSALFARDDDLATLDQAWDDPHCHLVSIVADGGVGKSALVNTWLNRIAPEYRGAERVYGSAGKPGRTLPPPKTWSRKWPTTAATPR